MNCDSTPIYNLRKRKRTSNAQKRVKKPRAADSPPVQKVNLRSQPSTPAPDPLQVLDLQPSPQPPAPAPELRVRDVSPQPTAAFRPEPVPSTPELIPDGVQQDTVTNSDAPLKIHGYSVEEYQKIYHSVVDDMLKYKTGRTRPYNLQLGRVIKQRLWETLGRPKMTTTEMPDGLLKIEESRDKEIYPPLINVDVTDEPDPWAPFRKRAK